MSAGTLEQIWSQLLVLLPALLLLLLLLGQH
jgi:hypothetical protein